MKKISIYILAAFAAFAMTLSCTQMEEPVNDSQEDVSQDDQTGDTEEGDESDEQAGIVTITATLDDCLTKVTFIPNYDAGKPESLSLTWAEGDVLRVYDHSDRTKYEDFDLVASSVGQKTGEFTGTLFEASSYDVEVLAEEEAGSADNQIQPSDGVATSLKYMACATEVTDLKSFSLTGTSNFLALTAKLPAGAAAGIKSVEMKAGAPIFYGGNTLTVTFETLGDAGEDDILHIFASLPSQDQDIAEGTTMFVTFNAPETDHTVYTRYIELGAQTLTSGKLNTINVNASASDKHAGLTTCDGTAAGKAYLIADKYQMQAMHDLMTADATTYFKMVADVDMAGIVWEPLNLVSPWSKGIYFDGGDHTIYNFSSDGETYAYPSFAGILNGTVCNVTFDKADVQCAGNKGGVIAGYFGHKENALEAHCVNVTVKNSNVTSTTMLGAFAAQGDNVTTLSKCSVINTGVTSTGAIVGGFIGSLVQADKISDCTAEGVVIDAGQYAGGFIGSMAEGTLTGCSVSGTVTSTSSYAGGFVGNMKAGTLTGCTATVDVTAASFYSGGLVGYAATATLTDCHAAGKVVNNRDNYSRTGGLVGEIHGGSVTRCSATGGVEYKGAYGGGLIGVIDGKFTITESYATGEVYQTNGKNYHGGLIGFLAKEGDVAISNCYATGAVRNPGNNYCGGFIGYSIATSIQILNSYSKSEIESKNAYSGCIFISSIGDTNTLSCTGFIGWNVSNKGWCYVATDKTSIFPDENSYMGTEGTISAKAKAFEWNETIWDLTGDVPVLMWTLANDNQ